MNHSLERARIVLDHLHGIQDDQEGTLATGCTLHRFTQHLEAVRRRTLSVGDLGAYGLYDGVNLAFQLGELQRHLPRGFKQEMPRIARRERRAIEIEICKRKAASRILRQSMCQHE